MRMESDLSGEANLETEVAEGPEAFEAMKRVIVELIKLHRYSKRENNNFKRSHFSKKNNQLDERRNARESIDFIRLRL